MLILVGLKTFTADYLPGPNAGTVAIVGAVRVLLAGGSKSRVRAVPVI